ncbi:LexA family protein [Acidithiobacillus sp.]|uniref:LexA family protein n=1 Tax=Acidithiobacillus sp. TaxID=1872118 RepID=UPI003D08ACC3
MLSAEKVARLRAAGLEVHSMPLTGSSVRLPLFVSPVRAGQPATAEDDRSEDIPLGDWLVPCPERSFLVRVQGDSMTDFGILEGDVLVVEQGSRPKMGDMLIAQIHGSYTVKQLGRHEGKPALLAGNAAYAPIVIVPGETRVAGVVRSVVRRYVR